MEQVFLNKKRGVSIILSVLLLLAIALILVIGFTSPLVRELQSAFGFEFSKAAYYLAEAGSEDAVYRIKNAMQISSSESISLDGNSASITIIDTSNGKEISVSGDVYSRTRNIKTELSTSVTGIAFAYGAQVGEGGLKMNNNATVEGTGGAVGNVYSNGSIGGISNSLITGDAIVAGNLVEDNQAQSTVCNTDQIVGNTDPQIDFAQSFRANSTSPLAKVSLYIKKVGNPSSRTVHIVADNTGSPDTISLASGTLDKNLVGTSYGWIDVTFTTPPTLTSGQDYWIVLDASQHGSKYWVWCSDSNNGFGNGVGKYKDDWSSGGAWTQITGDLNFKTFFGSGVTSIDSVVINGDAKANTITNTTVGGDAYYDSNFSGSTAGGTQYPGSTDPAPLAMPLSDANIADWRLDAEAGGTIAGSCPGTSGCGSSMGPVKIDGDLTITEETVTLTGIVYVTGDILMDNNVVVQCDVAFGDDSCILLADGWIKPNNNVALNGSGHPDSYVLAVSTLENCLGGSQQPQCSDSNSAIYLNNNVVGGLFYTTDSLLYMNNNVDVVSVIGYMVELNNNATVIYETGAADENFSSGPGGGWKISTWKEVE